MESLSRKLNIRIIGTGYVGLVAGACFAEMGYPVVCVDQNQEKIKTLKSGKVPFYEPGLEEIVLAHIKDGSLSFEETLSPGESDPTLYFIAVGTPSAPDGSADLSYVYEAANNIADIMSGYSIIVTKSTVPIGTTFRIKELVQDRLAARGAGHLLFDTVNNPEFLREGCAVTDFLEPARIVIGTANEQSASWMKELYRPLTGQGYPLVDMDITSSEMTKYASNTMLAARISFMNEISRICDSVGADVEAVRNGMGYDPRIGRSFLAPGVGYGGSCFPKDVKALIHTASLHHVPAPLLQAVETVNEEQKVILAGKINKHFGTELAGRRFAIWGLAFKPNTDDIRESPALDTIRTLRRQGAVLQVHDPMAMDNTKRELEPDGVIYCTDPYQALAGADALLVMTEWPEYAQADLTRMKSSLKTPVVLDGRNLFNPARMRELRLIYESIGRP